VEHPRGHRGGMATPAVVRGVGIGAAPSAAAPTAMVPSARHQWQRQGRGAVGALGGAARRRQVCTVGGGGDRTRGHWEGRRHVRQRRRRRQYQGVSGRPSRI